MEKRQHARLVIRYTLVAVWLLFTLALTAWWAWFAMHQLRAPALPDSEHVSRLVRYQRMLVWEGGTLFICLTGAGIWLIHLIRRERKESQRSREFFASFTHDLKTPLAAVRLQAEVLRERLEGHADREKMERLISDIERLSLRLENSLFLSSDSRMELLEEEVRLSDLMRMLDDTWPSLKIVSAGDCVLSGDRRALEVILGNILQNASIHGRASEVKVSVTARDEGRVELRVEDNGEGFRGSISDLGRLFARPAPSSGSGMGLYLVRTLLLRMGGSVEFHSPGKGFAVVLHLKGHPA